MPIRLLSDLHLEFHRDGGHGFISSLTAAPDEILVLAGDIAVGEGLLRALPAFCRKWRDVVYVAGNHEYYHHRPSEVTEILAQIAKQHANFHWLNASSVVLGGQRFIGGTLWFSELVGDAPGRYFLSDFSAIEDFEPWVYREHQRTVHYLYRELREGDIVVTHHLPSQLCVADNWKNSPLNPFFVHDLSDLIRQRGPVLWLHGHTHEPVDVQVGTTRILVNPFGYLGQEEQPGFQAVLRVVVWARRLSCGFGLRTLVTNRTISKTMSMRVANDLDQARPAQTQRSGRRREVRLVSVRQQTCERSQPHLVSSVHASGGQDQRPRRLG